ncbi:MAG: tRNA pseudouridine(55) synthase TruB [Porticoccaceae bacterium]|nr:tRNA pseudouridine(55) synthase TruB [Porticoccaceae bacterium]
MGRRRKSGRSVNGVLLLNKPIGLTSNKVLQKVRWLFDANRAGHTGALDPLASGVLPLCFGEATKFSQYLLDSDKYYRSTYTLGISTTTGDSEGEVISQQDASNITLQQVQDKIQDFQGEIDQVPSMYSALKHNGQPLYKLARQGIEIDRPARQITIFDYQITDFRPGTNAKVDVEVHCSKGTYIRTLAEDLGASLGCGAHVSALHRFRAGPFDEQQAISLEELEKLREQGSVEQLDQLLKPVDTPVSNYPAVEFDQIMAGFFQLGQEISSNKAFHQGQEGDIVRVFREGGTFLGIGTVTEDGKIAPKRLIVEDA